MSQLYLHGEKLSLIVHPLYVVIHHIRKYIAVVLIFSIIFLLAACTQTPEISQIPVIIIADGSEKNFFVDVGASVQSALDKAGIKLNPLDKINPPGYTLLTGQTTIQITRVREEYEIEELIIPFEHQTQRNESLPEGQSLLMQSGINGLKQITYRRIFEENVETSWSVFKEEIITEARPEIMMIGVQSPFTSIQLKGKIVYLTSGNTWVMEGSTSNRHPIITNGNLDGRVFKLSEDGKWLLFTQKGAKNDENAINSLWVINLDEDEPSPVYLLSLIHI